MDTLINISIGIALGAAFSPFWMKVYAVGKAWVSAKINKQPPPAA